MSSIISVLMELTLYLEEVPCMYTVGMLSLYACSSLCVPQLIKCSIEYT